DRVHRAGPAVPPAVVRPGRGSLGDAEPRGRAAAAPAGRGDERRTRAAARSIRRAGAIRHRTSRDFIMTSVPSFLRAHAATYANDPRGAGLEWFREARYGL